MARPDHLENRIGEVILAAYGEGATHEDALEADRDDHLEAGGNDVQPFGPILADLHHVGAAAGADPLRGFDHLFDARQMIWQMAKVAFGWRTSGPAIGIALRQRCPGSLGFRDGRFQILESQLTLIGGQLLGTLAKKHMAQLGDEVILTFSLRLQPGDLGLHGRKCLTHSGRKAVQIKGEIGGRRHGDLYRTPARLPIFTRRSESFCRGGMRRSGRMDTAPIKTRKQRLELHPRQPHDPVANLWPGKAALLQALVDHHDPTAVPEQNLDPVATL